MFPHSSWELEVTLKEKIVLSTADQRCWYYNQEVLQRVYPFWTAINLQRG